MASRYPLRIKLNLQREVETRKPSDSSSASRSQRWRNNLKQNSEEYAVFLRNDAVRAQLYRASLPEVKRLQQNEKAKVRMRRYRQRLKEKKSEAEGQAGQDQRSKPTTRGDDEKKSIQRARWKETK